MKRLFFVLFFFTLGSCNTYLSIISNTFDEEKWLTSSEYRYYIAKSNAFPDFKNKSKDEVKNILGAPDAINGDLFIYCFDINSLNHHKLEKKSDVCNCEGSFVSIDFKIDERWRTTITWAESSIKK